MFEIKCFILCLSLAALRVEADAGDLSFIDPCKYTDTECLQKSAKKAMPYVIEGLANLGMPSFDPLVIKEEIKADNGGLKLGFKNITVKNIPKCEIIKVVRPEKLRFEIEIACPITATGEYDADGYLILVPISGKGNFEITSDKIRFTVSVHLKVIEKDGQKYYKFKSFDFTYEALEKVYIVLHNLYNGDKEKALPILKILDESWKEIFNEIAKPIITKIIKIIMNTIEKIFLNIPCNKIELD